MDPSASNKATGILTYAMWGEDPSSSRSSSDAAKAICETPKKQVGRILDHQSRKLPISVVLDMIRNWRPVATNQAWNTTLDIIDYAPPQVMNCIASRHKWAIEKFNKMHKHLRTRPAPAALVQVDPKSL